jgi:hypothetical protein
VPFEGHERAELPVFIEQAETQAFTRCGNPSCCLVSGMQIGMGPTLYPVPCSYDNNDGETFSLEQREQPALCCRAE